MSGEWREAKLGAVITLKRGYDLPKRERRTGRFPIVSSAGISGWHDEPKVKAPGVVTGRYGTIGDVYFIRKDFWPLNTALYVSNFKGNDQRFISYLVKTLDFDACNDKGAVPGLNRNDLHELVVDVPPLPIQRRIARILGTLDDKIELNRQMNRTLEAMASALFKSWFVNFDPVVAKSEGRAPSGMSAEIARLFPSQFQESEMGPIPEGWEAATLEELLVLQRGFDLPATQRIPGSYPVVQASGPADTHREYRVRGPGVVTGRSGLLGRVFFVHKDFWPLNTTLWVKEFRAASPIYAYFLLQELDFEQFNAGSAVPTVNRNHVHNLPFVKAPRSLVDAFGSVVGPMLARQRTLSDQSRTLAALRDALLPKLLSGEIELSEAERRVEDAA